jgi:alcohol dehydrogenase (cytochrome c)
MRNAAYVIAILLATCAPAYTQTGVTGTWQAASGSDRWTLILRLDGPRLIGAARACGSPPIEISDGAIDGNTITFKCKSREGAPLVHTITLTGKLNGDEITFTWDLQGEPNPPTGSIFSLGAPSQFTAKRVPDGIDPEIAEMADRARALTFDRILHADQEPKNWLTYSGTLFGERYSRLTQITPTNVRNLELAWIWQAQSAAPIEATALVVDGVLYTVQGPNDVVALNATTGSVLWTYPYTPAPQARASGGGGRPNRGLAILGNTLFLGTLDAHLLAIDTKTHRLIWNTTVANVTDPACQRPGQNQRSCYVITHAPLVVKDKVIVGVGGGEGPTRCFIAAFDVITGKEVWRFYTIPAPGEPGNETWSGDSWKTGGGGVWNIGSYDPDLNLTYWGTGNPYPTENGNIRLGDNLYSESVVALDADTGKLKWYYQFTPHDDMDWDAAQVPVLTDLQWQGRPRKVMLWANRNGLMYVLDRTTGQFLKGQPFVEVNWMTGFDDKGRPLRVPGKVVAEGVRIMPGLAATQWIPPSYSPRTGLFYISAWERGSSNGYAVGGNGYSAVRAFDPTTGERKWEFRVNDAMFRGVLTTASDLLFTGVVGDFYSAVPSMEAIAAGARRSDRIQPDPARLVDGYFYALDARTGDQLWRMSLAGSVTSGPMSYSVNGKQYVTVAAGNTLFAFALRQ